MHPYLQALLGGILIGLSASAMLGGLGRITGISGIFMGLFSKPNSEETWRFGFMGGLLFGGAAFLAIKPELLQYDLSSFSYWHAIVAGLLVGFGTRLGGGCTSGHGVCGLPRLSKRSFIATITFIGFGVITVAFRRFLL
ncbi:MAG: YeeE/YedE thiosulfate transporter family protein [Bacteriovoracaceae bacterium]